MEADLLSLDFPGVARYETGLRQRRLQLNVVVDQGARDPVPDGAGLTRFSTADHVYHHVECLLVIRQSERLAHDHSAGLTGEELVDGLLVDDDVSRAFFDEDPRHRSLAPARAVIVISDHRGVLGYGSTLVGDADQISSVLGCCAECGCAAPA